MHILELVFDPETSLVDLFPDRIEFPRHIFQFLVRQYTDLVQHHRLSLVAQHIVTGQYFVQRPVVPHGKDVYFFIYGISFVPEFHIFRFFLSFS